jgi:hypothetical protein
MLRLQADAQPRPRKKALTVFSSLMMIWISCSTFQRSCDRIEVIIQTAINVQHWSGFGTIDIGVAHEKTTHCEIMETRYRLHLLYT